MLVIRAPAGVHILLAAEAGINDRVEHTIKRTEQVTTKDVSKGPTFSPTLKAGRDSAVSFLSSIASSTKNLIRGRASVRGSEKASPNSGSGNVNIDYDEDEVEEARNSFDEVGSLSQGRRRGSSFDQCVPINRRGSTGRRRTLSSMGAMSNLPIIGEHQELDPEGDEKAERQALIDLWSAFEGKGWRRSRNWCSDKPLDEWEGIKTVSGRVEEIKLTNNTLRGLIPESIEKLTMLKRVLLAENFIAGPLPEALGGCKSLENLTLNDNEITGELPASMAQLEQLQQLNLSENSITGSIPASWRRLTSVESIVLWGNQLSGKLPWVIGEQAPMLRYLDLRNNSFGDEDKKGIALAFGLQIPSHNLNL
jgi:hypothetical protein